MSGRPTRRRHCLDLLGQLSDYLDGELSPSRCRRSSVTSTIARAVARSRTPSGGPWPCAARRAPRSCRRPCAPGPDSASGPARRPGRAGPPARPRRALTRRTRERPGRNGRGVRLYRPNRSFRRARSAGSGCNSPARMPPVRAVQQAHAALHLLERLVLVVLHPADHLVLDLLQLVGAVLEEGRDDLDAARPHHDGLDRVQPGVDAAGRREVAPDPPDRMASQRSPQQEIGGVRQLQPRRDVERLDVDVGW